MDKPGVDLLVSPAVEAQAWPRLVAALWPQAPAVPTCLCAPLTGEAVLLGRFQCARSVLGVSPGLPAARRVSGGRAILAGEGGYGFLLVLPHTGALLPGQLPVPASKIVNRYVRPVLGALAALGASAGWFGRDFISAGGRPVAYVSFEVLPGGAALVEAFVSFAAPLLWPRAYGELGPGPEGEKPWASLAEIMGAGWKRPGEAQWLAALRRGFEERLGAVLGQPQAAPAPQDPAWPSVDEPLPPRGSALRDIAIGRCEARVEIDQLATLRRPELGATRVLGRARLLGDFQADASSIVRLEESLAGCPATFEQVGARIDAVFGPAAAGTLVGLKSLRPLAEALVEAAAAKP